MQKFLEQVADYYMEPERRSHMEDYIFVFPNRRSGRFLKRYIQQRASDTMFMPRFVTIGSLVARMSGVPEASQRKCLFELYAAYREVLASHGGTTPPSDFDRFIFWGQMILNDFDEIDRNGVDAHALYTNLGRVREISADYLDESQRAVARELFGENAVPDSAGRFWNHMTLSGEDDIKSRFLSLWAILPEIYEAFVSRLQKQGYTTAGRQYREALQNLGTDNPMLAGVKYVFVGFNNPGTMEILIFDRMRHLGIADFFWDTSSPYVSDGHGGVRPDNAAFRSLGRLVRRFPMPADFESVGIDRYPDITAAGIPSRTAQTKLAAQILREWAEAGYIDLDNPIGTAVILPDESLLMHMLHSLPPEIRAVNITMGLPFAGTSFAALLRSIVSMQMRIRRVRGTWRFFYEDVLEVTGHPHLRTAAGEEGSRLRDYIIGRNLYTLDSDMIAACAPSLAFIFRAVEDMRDIGGVGAYLSELFDGLSALFAAVSGAGAGWEIQILGALRADIDEIAAMIREYGVEAGERSYFALFERALRGMTITMAGTPLKGMQIMSMAETRGLDFDNVMILSMNERIFPQRSVAGTMIPNNLRAGYGLPPTDRAENDSAYYFYRLIGRAQRVALLYDSRDAGSGTGEASRFISQLQYLYPDAGNLHFRNVDFGAIAPEKRVISIDKKGAVEQLLRRFREGGQSCISASALKNYKHCGLKFYLQNVCRLSGEEAVTGFMDMASFGTIFHASAQAIYDDYREREMTPAVLRGIVGGLADRYTPVVERLINKYYYNREDDGKTPMPVEGQIMRDLMIDILRKMFSLEIKKWGETEAYRYRQGEMEVVGPWQIAPELTINFKMKIDRVDKTAEGLRFIDYKTGSDKLDVKFADIFDSTQHHTDAVLQILAYCEAYAAITGYTEAIQPSLYVFLDMIPQNEIRNIKIDGQDITDYRSVSAEFLPALRELICEIFDVDKPFVQAAEDSPSCNYCVFAPMCGRVKTPRE